MNRVELNGNKYQTGFRNLLNECTYSRNTPSSRRTGEREGEERESEEGRRFMPCTNQWVLKWKSGFLWSIGLILIYKLYIHTGPLGYMLDTMTLLTLFIRKVCRAS